MNYYYYLNEQQQQQYYPFIKVYTNMNVVVYVGELPPNVDQFELHKFIMTKGNFNVEAIYIRNNYNQSFAYVKFKTQNEAETAIKVLHMQNFKDYIIKAEHFKFNRECSNDKTKMEGNVVIKNLPTDTTPKEVYDMFVQFGNVVSVNVRKDSNMGVIGFVSFDKEESAVNAVDKVNMRNYKGNALNVKLNGKQKDYNNNNNNEYGDRMLLVRNMPKDVEGDEWLKEVFGVYGNVVVCGVVNDEQQERMGVVVYGRREETENAFNVFSSNNNKGFDVVMIPIDNEVIDIVKGNEMKKDVYKKRYNNDGCKLVIKNIPHEINEDKLCDIFKQYGDVLNAKIHNDNKGNVIIRNGYVIFTNTHDAKQAQNALNNVDYEYNGVKMKLQIECYNYNNTHYHHHQQQQSVKYQYNKYNKKNKYNNYPTRNNKQQHNTHFINNNSHNKYSSLPDNTFPMNVLPISNPNQINTAPLIHNENIEQRITVESECLVDKVKQILQIENINERTETLGEVLFYFLMKFIPQYKLNITEGKCDDTTISSKLTGILIRTNADNLLQMISTTTHLKNSLQDILLKLIQANRLDI